MNVINNVMNAKIRAVASAIAVLALVLGVFTLKTNTVVAETDSANSYSSSSISCSISVVGGKRQVSAGDDVTISWNTSGASSVTITMNGTPLSGISTSGSETFTLSQNTTFELVASNGSSHPCTGTVTIGCEPPPVCNPEVTKTVDKTNANPGDELTYTITVKNIGNRDCTGSGVKIFDVLDPNLTYVRHTLTGDVKAGYGNEPVYKDSDRTLRFNGETLRPNESVTINWVGKIETPSQCGDFEVKNKAKVTAKELGDFQNWIYSNEVTTQVENDCYVPVPSCDSFDAAPPTIMVGATSTLTWETTNATEVLLDGVVVNADDSQVVSPVTTTTYVLTVNGENNQTTSCQKEVIVTQIPTPSCDLFKAVPDTIVAGATSTLTWETTNVDHVVITNGPGLQPADGSYSVAPLNDTTYVLTAFDLNNQTVTCEETVVVTSDPEPICKSFTATPGTLAIGGGNVTLNWEVEDATNVSISPTVGNVGLTGSTSVAVTNSTTFVLTATDADGDETTCEAPVTVPEPNPFTCAGNVVFTASETSIKPNQNVTLNWSTTDVDKVAITHINLPGLSGSEVVAPADDITYILTATKDDKSIDCPLSIDVSSGGGGGGSSLRCDLKISDTKIKLGEEITLTWDTTRATEVSLTDDRGKELFNTDDYLADEKEDYYDGSITLKPTRDTEYTLYASRGSRDKECAVEVEIEDDVTVLQTRTQEPLVAGISLSQVPYTGFEAGPIMTLMFYVVLVAWALYVAYFIAVRNRPVLKSNSNENQEVVSEDIHSDPFVASTAVETTPVNLPTGSVVDYGTDSNDVNIELNNLDSEVAELEDRAHSQHALLSGDAVRHFISTTEGKLGRNEALDAVIAEAKKAYELEDGWIVINEPRMRELCQVCMDNLLKKEQDEFIPTVIPEGTGSLAEAIVTGNVVAAYDLVGNRPMFSLADAAADLDAVYRNRLGKEVKVSEMLLAETKRLSDDDIKNMIAALTGALDGTYTDEAAAVKMAIMKAIRIAG